MTSGISEDIPTGETPKKRSWTIQKNWERTQPRNILIDNYRKKKASGELSNDFDESSEQSHSVQQPITTSINVEVTVEDDEESLKSLKSVESLNEVTENLTTKIPGLSNSQIRIPSNFKGKSGLDRSVSGNLGKKTNLSNGNNGNAMEEKISVAPLGESGMNVPRRGRR